MYSKKERDPEIDALQNIVATILRQQNFCREVDQENVPAYKIAVKLWEHQQRTKEPEMESLIKDARTSVTELLRRTEDRIQDNQRDPQGKIVSSSRHYSDSAVRKVMNILKDDLEKQFDPKVYHEDVKGFLKFKPRAHAWEETENILIDEIQTLLEKHKPGVSTNWKVDIVTSIFSACGLWPDRKNQYETMRKRFAKIHKQRPDRHRVNEKINLWEVANSLCF